MTKREPLACLVTLPEGVPAEKEICVRAADGKLFKIQVPDTVGPGGQFRVIIPGSDPTEAAAADHGSYEAVGGPASMPTAAFGESAGDETSDDDTASLVKPNTSDGMICFSRQLPGVHGEERLGRSLAQELKRLSEAASIGDVKRRKTQAPATAVLGTA